MDQVEKIFGIMMGDQAKMLPKLKDRSEHPFVPRLLNTIVPPGLGIPKVEEYDGEQDPVRHVLKHEMACLGRADNEDYVAVLFPATLGDRPLMWFFGQPAASIENWRQLRDMFVKHYTGRRRLLKNASALDDVIQGEDEALGRFYSRFTTAVAEVDEAITESEIVRAFAKNLRPPVRV